MTLSCFSSCGCAQLSSCRRRTCVPLEARAPLRAGYDFVGVRVAGFEESIRAWLVPVQVEALDLRLVQLQVKVCVQPGEHPAQGILTNRGGPDVELYRRRLKRRECRCSETSLGMNECGVSTQVLPCDSLFFSGFWILTLLWLPFSCSTLNQSLRRLTTSFRSDSLHTEE